MQSAIGGLLQETVRTLNPYLWHGNDPLAPAGEHEPTEIGQYYEYSKALRLLSKNLTQCPHGFGASD